jgi:peptidoglycan/xylan/chitin deacetylase (PgdA/CDA1 family)
VREDTVLTRRRGPISNAFLRVSASPRETVPSAHPCSLSPPYNSRVLTRLLNRGRDFWFLRPLDRLAVQPMRGVVTCYVYHRVDDPKRHPFLTRGGSPVIAPRELEKDIRFLQLLDARFFTFEDLRKGRYPARSEIGVILSFDDGFACNYTTGAGVLDLLRVPAVFFQSTAMVEAERLLWEHALYWHSRDAASTKRLAATARAVIPSVPADDAVAYLRETAPFEKTEEVLARLGDGGAAALAAELYPTAAQIRRVRSRGHEIGSHGHRHLKRTSIDAATFEQELSESRDALAHLLNELPGAFSYPFNSRVSGDEQICAAYFEQGVTVDAARITTRTDPMLLPRYTWPGRARTEMRRRRWLLTGRI